MAFYMPLSNWWGPQRKWEWEWMIIVGLMVITVAKPGHCMASLPSGPLNAEQWGEVYGSAYQNNNRFRAANDCHPPQIQCSWQHTTKHCVISDLMPKLMNADGSRTMLLILLPAGLTEGYIYRCISSLYMHKNIFCIAKNPSLYHCKLLWSPWQCTILLRQ